jgi:hypothetical protein
VTRDEALLALNDHVGTHVHVSVAQEDSDTYILAAIGELRNEAHEAPRWWRKRWVRGTAPPGCFRIGELRIFLHNDDGLSTHAVKRAGEADERLAHPPGVYGVAIELAQDVALRIEWMDLWRGRP